MKTGLTKRQKTTCIYFDEASKAVEIQTHNTALKKTAGTVCGGISQSVQADRR